jgi:sulfhydrogenase subunit delta
MTRPRIAVFKLASCDGCQLTLLDCEDELLAVAGRFEIVHFLEATSRVEPGPYDVVLVEGSITTPHDARRVRELRDGARFLVALGACATSGGVQALRAARDLGALARAVYPRPELLDTLATSTPLSAHIPVDLELRGCPIDKGQLLEVLTAVLAGRRPQLPAHPVCVECKRRGTVCLTVARGVSCLGPVTHAGCGALCPSYDRGCFGCFGPSDGARPGALPGGVGDPWVYR